MKFSPLRYSIILAILAIPLSASGQPAPEFFPDKVLGYKVHRADISFAVRSAGELRPTSKFDFLLTLDEPVISSIGLTGVRAEAAAEIESSGQQGTVELVMFRDFTVNGIPVKIGEVTEKFRVSRKRAAKLSAPIVVEISSVAIARNGGPDLLRLAVLNVRGTVLVFGNFKKLGFGFKRMIPLRVAFSVKNSLLR